MPQLNTVTLGDRQTPAVLHDFVPRGIEGSVATLVESTGIPIGDRKITVSSTRTGNGRAKVTIKLAIPVVQDQVIAGVNNPVLLRTAYAETVFSFDASSTKQERADISELMTGLLSSGIPMTKKVIEDLEGLF